MSSVRGWRWDGVAPWTTSTPPGAAFSSATAVVLPGPPPRSTPMNLVNGRFTPDSLFYHGAGCQKALIGLAFRPLLSEGAGPCKKRQLTALFGGTYACFSTFAFAYGSHRNVQ